MKKRCLLLLCAFLTSCGEEEQSPREVISEFDSNPYCFSLDGVRVYCRGIVDDDRDRIGKALGVEWEFKGNDIIADARGVHIEFNSLKDERARLDVWTSKTPESDRVAMVLASFMAQMSGDDPKDVFVRIGGE